jgi:hypothetical protein
MSKNASMNDSPSLILVRVSPDKPSGEVFDLQTLKSWAKEGKLRRDQAIFDPQTQSWVPACQFGPILGEFTQGLWDAWDAIDSPQKEAKPVAESKKVEKEPELFDSGYGIDEFFEMDITSEVSTVKSKEGVLGRQVEEMSIEEDPLSEVLAMFEDSHESEEIELLPEGIINEMIKDLKDPISESETKPEGPDSGSNGTEVVSPIVHEDLPLTALHELPEELPVSAMSPLNAGEMKGRLPRRDIPKKTNNKSTLGEVGHGADFRLPLMDTTPIQRPPQHKETNTIRWGRILMFTLPFFLIFLTFRWYLVRTATAQNTSTEQDMQTGGEGDAVPALVNAPLNELDAELRGMLRPTCLLVDPEHIFEDIMTVELNSMEIDSIGIRATVVEWTGRKNDKPKTAIFRFHIQSSGAIDRDLAAVSLVVGKYIHRYLLGVAQFEIQLETDSGTISFDVDPDTARNYYLERIDIIRLMAHFSD